MEVIANDLVKEEKLAAAGGHENGMTEDESGQKGAKDANLIWSAYLNSLIQQQLSASAVSPALAGTGAPVFGVNPMVMAYLSQASPQPPISPQLLQLVATQNPAALAAVSAALASRQPADLLQNSISADQQPIPLLQSLIRIQQSTTNCNTGKNTAPSTDSSPGPQQQQQQQNGSSLLLNPVQHQELLQRQFELHAINTGQSNPVPLLSHIPSASVNTTDTSINNFLRLAEATLPGVPQQQSIIHQFPHPNQLVQIQHLQNQLRIQEQRQNLIMGHGQNGGGMTAIVKEPGLGEVKSSLTVTPDSKSMNAAVDHESEISPLISSPLLLQIHSMNNDRADVVRKHSSTNPRLSGSPIEDQLSRLTEQESIAVAVLASFSSSNPIVHHSTCPKTNSFQPPSPPKRRRRGGGEDGNNTPSKIPASHSPSGNQGIRGVDGGSGVNDERMMMSNCWRNMDDANLVAINPAVRVVEGEPFETPEDFTAYQPGGALRQPSNQSSIEDGPLNQKEGFMPNRNRHFQLQLHPPPTHPPTHFNPIIHQIHQQQLKQQLNQQSHPLPHSPRRQHHFNQSSS